MQIKTEADLQKLLQALTDRRPQGKAVAAFDADGTLWDIDMGETFFDYVIKHRLVPLPEDPWKHYFGMQEEVSKEAAYLWLAQIFNGVPLKQVRQWAKESVAAAQPVPVFEMQKKIIRHLQTLGVDVYIVTASIKWAVEPAAELVGLTPDQVLGIETEVTDGVVGMKQKGILTYREGKALKIVEASGLTPYFCSGNTEGDLELLQSASAVRFVMSNTALKHPNFETEQTLLDHARQEGWFYRCL
jgi:phosphoserine phosphatase